MSQKNFFPWHNSTCIFIGCTHVDYSYTDYFCTLVVFIKLTNVISMQTQIRHFNVDVTLLIVLILHCVPFPWDSPAYRYRIHSFYLSRLSTISPNMATVIMDSNLHNLSDSRVQVTRGGTSSTAAPGAVDQGCIDYSQKIP